MFNRPRPPTPSNPRIGTEQSVVFGTRYQAEAHGIKVRSIGLGVVDDVAPLIEVVVQGGKSHLRGIRFKTEQGLGRKDSSEGMPETSPDKATVLAPHFERVGVAAIMQLRVKLHYPRRNPG